MKKILTFLGVLTCLPGANEASACDNCPSYYNTDLESNKIIKSIIFNKLNQKQLLLPSENEWIRDARKSGYFFESEWIWLQYKMDKLKRNEERKQKNSPENWGKNLKEYRMILDNLSLLAPPEPLALIDHYFLQKSFFLQKSRQTMMSPRQREAVNHFATPELLQMVILAAICVGGLPENCYRTIKGVISQQQFGKTDCDKLYLVTKANQLLLFIINHREVKIGDWLGAPLDPCNPGLTVRNFMEDSISGDPAYRGSDTSLLKSFNNLIYRQAIEPFK